MPGNRRVYLALGSDAGAYRVPHGQGVVDEYNIFTRILGRSQQLDEHLAKGEAIIRQKFQEGKDDSTEDNCSWRK